MSDLDAIRAKHATNYETQTYCIGHARLDAIGEPCDTARVLAALDAAEQTIEGYRTAWDTLSGHASQLERERYAAEQDAARLADRLMFTTAIAHHGEGLAATCPVSPCGLNHKALAAHAERTQR